MSKKTIRPATDRGGRPYLSVQNEEGTEVAAMFGLVDEENGGVRFEFDQYADGAYRLVVTGASPATNETVWKS